MLAWLKQTSTRAALGTLLTTAAGVATGQMDKASALMTAVPILYGLIVHDKPAA